MRFVVSLIGITLVCAQAFADELDFSLNSDAFRLQYVFEPESSGLSFDAGWLQHTDNGDVLHGGLQLVDVA